jgi:acyl-[acyl-carrier-protein]-phospholipid O-acyltransferase/long-chain-fatty-acid--[acyl-carrier-protein] ligase
VIGVVLLALAVLGVVFATIILLMPPAAPDRPLVFAPWGPLKANFKLLSRSRPLRLAVVGIAFFTFMTLLMRQTLIFDGETKKDLHTAEQRLAATQATHLPADEPMPLAEAGEALVGSASETQAAELRVSLLIALVGLGVGIGSWLAGYLSGKKLELGLVPIGAAFIALTAVVLAGVAHSTPAMVGCLIMIGAAAGLYIVPLYTLLQHRAPKESKGGLVATSNFLNVAGGLVAVIAFYVVTFVLQTALGLGGQGAAVGDSAQGLAVYVGQLKWQLDIPRYLFVTASVLTVGMMFLLRRQLPDFFIRSLIWMRSFGRVRPDIVDLDHLPGAGPVVLVTSAASVDDALHLAAAADRYVRLVVVEDGEPAAHGERYLEDLASRARVLRVGAQDGWTPEWERAAQEALATLRHDDVVAINIGEAAESGPAAQLVERLRQLHDVVVLPVQCSVLPGSNGGGTPARRLRIAFAAPLPADAGWDEIVGSLRPCDAAAV